MPRHEFLIRCTDTAFWPHATVDALRPLTFDSNVCEGRDVHTILVGDAEISFSSEMPGWQVVFESGTTSVADARRIVDEVLENLRRATGANGRIIDLTQQAAPIAIAAPPSSPGADTRLNPTSKSADTARVVDYFLKARERDGGPRVVRRVQAASADQAVAMLEAEGLREIALINDDFTAFVLVDPAVRENNRKTLSPSVHSKMGNIPVRSFMIWMIATILKGLALPLLIVTGLLVWRRANNGPFGPVDWMLCTVFTFPLWAFWKCSFGTRVFCRVQRASLANRYDRVLKLLPALRKATRAMGDAASMTIVTEWKAKAEARLGRPEEALATVDSLRGYPNIPSHVYHMSRAAVVMCTRNYEATLAEYEKAIDADPQKPMGWVGAAETLAVYLNRPTEARVYLNAARQFPASDESDKMLRWLEAGIELMEGRAARAREEFDELLPHYQWRARCLPLGHGFVMVTHAMLCRACAASGDHIAARRHYDACVPFLERHKLTVFLEPCRRAIA